MGYSNHGIVDAGRTFAVSVLRASTMLLPCSAIGEPDQRRRGLRRMVMSRWRMKLYEAR